MSRETLGRQPSCVGKSRAAPGSGVDSAGCVAVESNVRRPKCGRFCCGDSFSQETHIARVTGHDLQDSKVHGTCI